MIKLETKNIYQRISEVMSEDIYIKKGSAGQGTGVLYDEVIAVLNKQMVKHGIALAVEKKGEARSRTNPKGSYIYEADFIVTLVNIDNPSDRVSAVVEAHAMDSGDKAPGKAITYATKTALLKFFCIETGLNDESREEQSEIAAGRKPMLASELSLIQQLLSETNSNTEQLISYLNINKPLADFNQYDAHRTIQALQQKAAKNASN